MSDNIPFDVQAEIIKSLPVDSLIRFRLVSKQWNSFITSSKFIAEYRKHHLLVRFRSSRVSFHDEYVLIGDDNTFPQHKVSVTLPMPFKMIHKPNTVISSQGLVFLHHYSIFAQDMKAVIWNPVLRKSVAIDLCCEPKPDIFFFGFGVCPDTCDPKVVKFSYYHNRGGTRVFELFTLSTNAWTTLAKKNSPRERISFEGHGVAIDRFIYWHAREARCIGDPSYRFLIVSFHMTSEEFTEIKFPDSLEASYLTLYNMGESLVMVQHELASDYCVWKMMGQGVSKSFTKLYSISDDVIRGIYGFRTSGEPFVQTNNTPQDDLFAYDPDSKHMTSIGIPAAAPAPHFCTSRVCPYIKTLLLLDH